MVLYEDYDFQCKGWGVELKGRSLDSWFNKKILIFFIQESKIEVVDIKVHGEI